MHEYIYLHTQGQKRDQTNVYTITHTHTQWAFSSHKHLWTGATCIPTQRTAPSPTDTHTHTGQISRQPRVPLAAHSPRAWWALIRVMGRTTAVNIWPLWRGSGGGNARKACWQLEFLEAACYPRCIGACTQAVSVCICLCFCVNTYIHTLNCCCHWGGSGEKGRLSVCDGPSSHCRCTIVICLPRNIVDIYIFKSRCIHVSFYLSSHKCLHVRISAHATTWWSFKDFHTRLRHIIIKSGIHTRHEPAVIVSP
jgi:hypothetical protein